LTSPLFRHEVLDAQRAQYLGGIRIGHNPRHDTIAWAAVVLTCVLIAFAIWGDVTRKSRVPGLLVPASGTLQVAAGASGNVIDRRVTEGERVRAGQVLFVLGTDRAAAQGDVGARVADNLLQRQQLLLAERRLREDQARQREHALNERLRGIAAEAGHAQSEADLAARRADLAARSSQRYRQLAESGFVSDIQAQTKQEELLDLEARAEASRRIVSALKREQAALRAEQLAVAQQLQADLSQLDRGLLALKQDSAENDGRRQLLVLAPQAGTVTALHAALGSAALPGQVLATLVPHEGDQGEPALLAELYAPSRTAGFVQPGQAVWLRYAAFPYQKFGMARATVSSVSQTPVNPQELPAGQAQALMAAARANEPMYRIRVALSSQHILAYGAEHRLRPGMALDGDIVQERRAIWEWVLEPVLALRASSDTRSTPNATASLASQAALPSLPVIRSSADFRP
jgi:membrane fusion protein